MKYTFSLLLFVLISQYTWAQKPAVHTRIEQQFHYVGNDSLPRFYKKWTYAPNGLLIERQEYYYSNNNKDAPGTLWREEKMEYDSLKRLYTLKKTQYARDKDPETETYKALYLVYDNDPAKSKPIWTKNLDNYGDYTKEDTFTYNENKDLVRYAFYNYTGNTSLFTDTYSYNKKNQRTAWRTYYNWTTVNIKGDVVDKKTRRRLYRYTYDKNGNLLTVKGKYYKTKYREKREYDANGKLERFESEQRLRSKNSKKMRKKTKKRFTMNLETRLAEYQDGRLVLEKHTKNGEQLKELKLQYRDTLLVNYEHFAKNKLVESRQFEYNAQAVNSLKITQKYDNDGKHRYTVRATFDDKGNLVEEQQISGDNVLSTLRLSYDEHGNILYSTLSLKTDVKFEKTYYTYSFYD